MDSPPLLTRWNANNDNRYEQNSVSIILSNVLGLCVLISAFFAYLQLVEMNGKMIVSKPLYFVLAQRKEERRARL